eukprot:3780324-Prymnesium_polylepis.1
MMWCGARCGGRVRCGARAMSADHERWHSARARRAGAACGHGAAALRCARVPLDAQLQLDARARRGRNALQVRLDARVWRAHLGDHRGWHLERAHDGARAEGEHALRRHALGDGTEDSQLALLRTMAAGLR